MHARQEGASPGDVVSWSAAELGQDCRRYLHDVARLEIRVAGRDHVPGKREGRPVLVGACRT